ncbi:MAG: hypothetical protein LUC47_01355 [Clostridiales bacterium]|nr:hypothetical protein [Clostridiales bacterium]
MSLSKNDRLSTKIADFGRKCGPGRHAQARTFGASAVKRHFRGFAPPCLCAFAGTCPAKSTDFNLFCCLRNKTPAEGFYNFSRCFIFESVFLTI